MNADFAGHTPGPWTVDPMHPRDIQAGGIEVSMTFHECMNRSLLVSGFLPLAIDEAEANARLIAAAPDLLKERDEQAREIERLKELYDATVEAWTERLAAAESALLAEQALRAEVSAALKDLRGLDEFDARVRGFSARRQPVMDAAEKTLVLTPGEALLKFAEEAYAEGWTDGGGVDHSHGGSGNPDGDWSASQTKAALEKGGAE